MTKNNVFASLIGQIIEWYDFTIYGFLAEIMAKNFFPQKNPITSLIYSLAVFSLGFIARPIGGWLFGYYGDYKGRKYAFNRSIFMMGIPTFLIALLPNYDVIAVLAPIALIILRIFQGLACGGEFIGATIFLWEHANKKNKIFWSGFTWIGSLLGTLLGICVCTGIKILLDNNALQAWGWRIPFFLSGITLIVGVWFRKQADETPGFINRSKKKFTIFSLKSIFHTLLPIMLMSIQLAVISYFVIIYMPTYLNIFLHYSINFSHTASIITIISLLFIIPIAGYLFNKIQSSHNLFSIITLFNIVLAYPSFILLQSSNFHMAIIGISLLIVMCSLTQVATFPLLMEIAPISIRFRTIAIPYNIAMSLFGGTTPMLITYCIHVSDNSLIPAYYLILASFFSLFGFILLKNPAIFVKTN